jgi:hypothetical protein
MWGQGNIKEETIKCPHHPHHFFALLFNFILMQALHPKNWPRKTNISEADKVIALLKAHPDIVSLPDELTKLTRMRNNFTPFLRLPNEILAEILVNAAYTCDKIHDQWRWDTSGTMTCNRTYHISMSTPKLWDRISLGWPSSRINTYLARSGTRPLAIEWGACHQSPINKHIDLGLVETCFKRAGAADIGLDNVIDVGPAAVAQLQHQLAPCLSSLFICV